MRLYLIPVLSDSEKNALAVNFSSGLDLTDATQPYWIWNWRFLGLNGNC